MDNQDKRNLVLPLLLIISLFFLGGMANHLNDILNTPLKKAFGLSDFASSFVQMSFHFGYFIFVIPVALLIKPPGYNSGVILGLLLYGVGAFLFYPAVQMHEYRVFLWALFVLASGLAFLEISASPVIVAMEDHQATKRRLNFAQPFNPLGALTGILIGREFILSGIEHSPTELAALSPVQLTQFSTLSHKSVYSVL